MYSVTLDEDEFDVLEKDSVSDGTNRSRRDKFLANVESKLNKDDPQHSVQLERLGQVKNQVLEKVKLTREVKSRNTSGSNNSKRRLSLSLFEENDRSKSRPRTSSPPTSSTSPPPSPVINANC